MSSRYAADTADSAPTAPGDQELQRLLTAHEDQAGAEILLATDRDASEAARDEATACLQAARSAVIAHIAAHYVRRPVNHLEYLERQQDARQS